jgi:hypothetical protein
MKCFSVGTFTINFHSWKLETFSTRVCVCRCRNSIVSNKMEKALSLAEPLCVDTLRRIRNEMHLPQIRKIILVLSVVLLPPCIKKETSPAG